MIRSKKQRGKQPYNKEELEILLSPLSTEEVADLLDIELTTVCGARSRARRRVGIPPITRFNPTDEERKFICTSKLPAKELAKMFGVSPQSIRGFRHRGNRDRLPADPFKLIPPTKGTK